MFSSKTTDCGSNWIRYYLEPIGYVYALAVDPNNSNIVYAGGNPGVYRTTNAGADWTDVSTGLTAIVMELAIDPFNTTTLYAATRDGVFKTTNSGGMWTNTGCTEVSTLVLDPSVPGTIYCGAVNGVHVSTDGGGIWTSMNDGLGDTNVTCIRIDPDNYLFIGTMNNGLYRWSLNTGVREYDDRSISTSALDISPNPLREYFVLSYTLPASRDISITLWDVQGRLVRELYRGQGKVGTHTMCITINDRITAPVSGVYFCRMSTVDSSLVKKIIILPK